MRAGKAYIASAGTTGILIAAAILLLVVVGALMAFDGEAQRDALPPVESVLLAPVERAQATVTSAGASEPSDARDGRGDSTAAAGAADNAAPGSAPRSGAAPNSRGFAAPAPIIPDLDDPPGEGSGDAQTVATPTAPPGSASEPSGSAQPETPVDGVVRDVTTLLPRPQPAP